MSRYAPATQVGDRVWRIRHSWGNAWALADGADVCLIDTGTTWDYGTVVAGLRFICGQRAPNLHRVILTHGHTDHAGCAARLAATFGAEIVCHRDEAVFVSTRRTYVPGGLRRISRSALLFALGEVFFPVRRRQAGVRLTDGETVDTPAGPLAAMHAPGHTPGHTAYVLAERAWVFSGDALINVIPWRMVVGLSLAPSVFTLDQALLLASAQAIVDMRPQGLLSGHGPAILEGTADRLAEFAARTIAPRRIRAALR